MLVALQFFIVGGLGSVGIGIWRLWQHAGIEHAPVALTVAPTTSCAPSTGSRPRCTRPFLPRGGFFSSPN
ncbi:hypothetical protein PSAC2689_110138 [Paraburkholderia sacchari]